MSKIRMNGPQVQLSPRETVSLSLVLHELATNSMKYGALRPDLAAGVNICWELAGDRLRVRWDCRFEQHRIAAPSREGFGLRMIRQAVERELSGSVEMDWQPDGLKFRLEVPLELYAVREADDEAHRAVTPALA